MTCLADLRRDRGFTLLEAIVALTIVGLTLVPVMSFLAESSRQISAVAEANLKAGVQQTAMAYLDVVNPMLMPSGEAPISRNLSVRWISQPLIDKMSDAKLGGRLGTYNINFYAVEATVMRDEHEWFTLQMRKIGYAPKSQGMMPQGEP